MIQKVKFVLNQENLKEILDYDAETGVFYWKKKIADKVKIGKRAGCVHTDNRGKTTELIRIYNMYYTAQKLAWIWVYGELPKRRLIHLDKNRANNAIANLREVVEKPKKGQLSREKLQELLHYNPETGIFTWLTSPHDTIPIGTEAVKVGRSGYVTITISGTHYRAHRLAWLYTYGRYPKEHIDHINGDPGDNRLCNLRAATSGENVQNIRKARSDNKSGLLGVHTYPDGSYYSRIVLNRVTYRLGRFKTAEEAHEAYVKKKRELHPFNTL